MKKILVAFGIMFPIFAHSESMCVKDGSIMVVLDPQIGGTTLQTDVATRTWSVQFSYGVVSGIIGCSISNVNANIVPAFQSAIDSYINANYCYCKMLRPVESLWVRPGSQAGCSGNISNCINQCTTAMTNAASFRQAIFSNIVQ